VSNRNTLRKEVIPYLMNGTILRHDGVTGVFFNTAGRANGRSRGKTRCVPKQQRKSVMKPLLVRFGRLAKKLPSSPPK
jgi:hypothetical protein